MAESNGSSSPDPLALPSSPLAPPASRVTRLRPLTLKSPNRFVSPTKSIVIDTPNRKGSSPWRIKVTVEAQPRHASPSRAGTRPTPASVAEVANITSPGKRANFESLEEHVGRRAQRRRLAPSTNPQTDTGDPPQKSSNMERADETHYTTVSPLRQPPRRRSRMNVMSATSQRSKRLSVARDELDEALQDAVGSPGSHAGSEPPGDLTVSANEDFSMVSMESLLSAKNTSLPQVLSAIPENQDSAAEISYLPSSPPKVQYPEISGPARDALASLGRSDYDAMSWKPTGPAQEFVFTQPSQLAPPPASQAAGSPQSENVGFDDDIWQEEASRSIGDQADGSHQQREEAPQEKSPQRFRDLFADEAARPPRPKIPRTWRRTSGHDFSYSDSPARPAPQSRNPSGGSTDGSGVLTPPSTDEEAGEYTKQVGGHHQTDDHSELSQPDAVGTLFETHPENKDQGRRLSARPEYTENDSSDSDSSVTSPDAEDTGLFWQTNLPNLYRRNGTRPRLQKRTATNVAAMLDVDAADDPEHVPDTAKTATSFNREAGQPAPTFQQQRKHGSLHLRPVVGNVNLSHSQSQNEKAICSPLRRSLLRSSKIPCDSKVAGGEPEHSQKPASNREDFTGHRAPARHHQGHEHDISQQNWKNHQQKGVEVQTHDLELVSEEDLEEESEPLRSYEEHLNLDSPMKINVKFNDSYGNSSLLAPTKEYPPLFGEPAGAEHHQPPAEHKNNSPPTITLVGPRPTLPAGNFLSRLSTTFWSAVIRPTGPTELLPPPTSHPEHTTDPYVFPAALRTQLRNRYGVVSEQFPWTMAHIRTLHRMLNSREARRADTLVPATGALPPALARLAESPQTSVTGHRFRFTRAHAHIVAAFAQLLVPLHVILAMRTGEVEWLGDALAKQCRGYYGQRHGDEAVWKVETHRAEVVEWVDGLKGPIGVEFVVRALGDVVWSNEQLARKQQK